MFFKMEAEELTYIKGYNQGYKLRLYSPELYELLIESLTEENDYQRGVLEGAAQAEKEKENERLAELNEITDENEQDQELQV
jgi:hypothetical protein